MLANINEIQKQVDEIIFTSRFSKTFSESVFCSLWRRHPLYFIRKDSYNYIYSERGYEFSRKVTHSLNTLLYWIMSEFAYQIAYQYELEHRVEGRDGRRIAFPKFIEIMANMNPAWESEARVDIQKILAEAPYDDSLYT
ncbi:Uncharacterised protein [Leclercia adecarboxylata]|uniref:Immunity protein 63 domain-containing protein n=1 Tax=Leclercia adecarboxylata TaxID=83655 RepID=A0A4U9IF44_9ENTR|nr:Uncharacterised protein [Leclercia adecarboxylata]